MITNNYIGVSATKHSLPNRGDRIDLSGQGDAVTSNLIANNARAGVYVLTGSVGNVLSRNSMYGNGNLGINLQGESQSTCPNGAVSGQANDYFDCPVITSATTTSVSGTAPVGSAVEVFLAQADIYDGGYGEGLTYVGSATATSSGTFTLAGSFITGKLVTATVTGVGPSGSTKTSEFSANATVN